MFRPIYLLVNQPSEVTVPKELPFLALGKYLEMVGKPRLPFRGLNSVKTKDHWYYFYFLPCAAFYLTR